MKTPRHKWVRAAGAFAYEDNNPDNESWTAWVEGEEYGGVTIRFADMSVAEAKRLVREIVARRSTPAGAPGSGHP